MVKRKKVVLLVTALAVASLVGLHFYDEKKSSRPISLSIEGFPAVGSEDARVEVVLFEDFRCTGCQYFDQEIYPELNAQYIETGKVRFVVIPLAFLDDSKMLANAAWEVFEQNPQQFFPYISGLFSLSLSTKPTVDFLIQIAKNLGGVDIGELKACIQNNCYYDLLDQNLQWAEKIMGKEFGTPTLYINGVKTPATSFHAIATQIERSI